MRFIVIIISVVFFILLIVKMNSRTDISRLSLTEELEIEIHVKSDRSGYFMKLVSSEQSEIFLARHKRELVEYHFNDDVLKIAESSNMGEYFIFEFKRDGLTMMQISSSRFNSQDDALSAFSNDVFDRGEVF